MSILQAGSTCWRTEIAPDAAVLVDMQAYLLAAKAAMLNAVHTIHFLNWAFDPDTVLDHETDDGGVAPQTIGAFLRALSEQKPGLDIRILCWKSPLPVAATQRFFPLRSRRFFAGTRIDFRLDATLPAGASHHQKVVVVDDVVAFCGSCDIGPDRWDTPEHAHPDPRRAKTARGHGCYDCRHEVMAMVNGAAASCLGDLFRDRWTRATGETLAGVGGGTPPVWVAGAPSDFSGILVGVSRTQAPWKGFEEIREGEAALLAAIASARHTLYLENQYYTSPLVAEALAQRLQESAGPEVVLVSTRHSPSWFDRMTMDKTRSRFLKRLEDADRHGRFRAYSPATRNGQVIIVHAKLAIADNRYIRIGSSNVNNRSEGFDSECDLTLDAGPGTGPAQGAVAGFRHRLVAHWLGCPTAVVSAAEAETGRLGDGIETLRNAGYTRLEPLRSDRHGALARFIADYHLGDPISAADSLRPWRRRAQMRHKLAAAVHRLQRAEMPAVEVPLNGPIDVSEPVSAAQV